MTIQNEPALALAMYASSAATVAVSALRRVNLVTEQEIMGLVENLTIARQAVGDEPRLIEHAELLTDMLQLTDRHRGG